MVTIRCGSKVFEQVEAVVFDKDGTLADAESFLKSLGQKRSRLVDAQFPGVQEPLMLAFGLEERDRLNPAGLLAVGSRYENEIAAAAYVAETGRDWVESLETVCTAFAEADKYLNRKADHTPLLEGVIELLQQLAAADLKLGLLSSDTPINVQDFVQRYQLETYFHHCLGVEAGLAKPNPALLHHACQALGVEPAKTLVIGDSNADIVMAHAAGAAGCIGVTWGWQGSLNLSRADAIAAQPTDIQVVQAS